MRILFVNPYIYDFTAYDLWLRPIGLLYLASVAKKYSDCEILWIDVLDRFQHLESKKSKEDGRGKFHREIVKKPEIYKNIPRNYSRYGIPIESFINKINTMPEVDFVFITTLMTFWIDGLNVTIKILKSRFPNSKIIVGGVIPSLVSEKIIDKYIKADYYIKGYGEGKIIDILNKNKCKTYKYPDFSNINNIPFPAFEFLSNKKFLPILTSRGCPYNCTYCASNILNKNFLERTAENILNEIYLMYNKYKTEHFIIFDDAFLINKHNRFFKVFTELKQKINVKFHTPNGLHANEVDEKTAQLLFESGFKTIRLGFESIKPEILYKSSNKVSIKHMSEAVKNLEKAGYRRSDIEVYLLFGFPGQRIKDIKDALYFSRDLGVVPRLSYFSPIPRTADFTNLQKRGFISKELNLYETNKIYFVYQKSGFSLEKIHYIKELTATITQSL